MMEINGCFFMKKYGEVEDMNLEINYYHVDVFADEKYAENGLTVVLLKEELAKEKMQMIAKEFKQFETIFLQLTDRNICRARIFTIDEEFDFAGHPILGAGAVIHAAYFEHENAVEVEFVLNNKEVKVTSKKKENKFQVEMNQGISQFSNTISKEETQFFIEALQLTMQNVQEDYLPSVVSNGLPYLIIPLKSGIEKAQIIGDDLEQRLQDVGAKFLYLYQFDVKTGRTWDNINKLEDVATGSAAGPTASYLWKAGCVAKEEVIEINQGQFLQRPSVIKARNDQKTGEVYVAGDVVILAKGYMLDL